VQSHLVQDLQDAISNASSGRRAGALHKVTDLLIGHGERLSEAQAALFGDVLLGLVEGCEPSVLAEFGSRLASAPVVPLPVLLWLARHPDARVAGPVLAQADGLSGDDLLDLAGSRGKDHQLAIADRRELDAALTEALIELGDRDVRYRVVSNEGAKISRTGFLRLVSVAARDPLLAEKTGVRADLPARLLRELLENAADAVRARIVSKAPASLRGEIQRHVDSIAQETQRRAERPRGMRAAMEMVERLKDSRELTEDKLIEFARDRQYESVIAALAVLASAPVALIQPLMRVHRNDGLMIACRAADLSWEAAREVILGRLSSVTAAEQDALRAQYAEVSFAAAKRALYIWQQQTMTPRRAG
jgi:uncharacterized protein (DUF2336 family)